ncbi:MAG: Unknown protein [uncultured Sulfurovum sp.]|uniref:Ribosome association toxin RatA n=1 Tax=uncultured Sulfurovum sp. TaxID=269237 RepID=A0A6S6SVV1_9BACT|nr:MAG: Unknown protein [uncultured Sulfurovum sp.]
MFSKKFTFKFETTMETSIEKLFTFHTDTNNLPKITPPWIKVKIVDLTLPLKEGSEISLDIKQYGLTNRWVMQIDKMQASSIICDLALKSPFKSFYHERKFEKMDENHAKLIDLIIVELPLYPLSIIAVPFMKYDMDRMFTYRHEKIKEILTIG